jgi:CDP-glucose 4,6-dehydratase
MNSSIFDIYKNKKVLVTGHTGFKGSWLSIWLNMIGADVIGISFDIPTSPSNFESSGVESFIKDYRVDIRDFDAIREVMAKEKPDFVFHLAAQALVKNSYQDPLLTFNTNTIGTANVLESLKSVHKKVVAVMITSDKAYDNVEWVWGYRETDRIGGSDPYSASKGMAELVLKSYINSYFKSENQNVKLGIARAGNVIGGGDWADDRIIPDCVKSWSKNRNVSIRSPNATRPWQHVLEPLSGYLLLGSRLYETGLKHGEAYNFGPSADQDFSVRNLINEMAIHWDNVNWDDVSIKSHDHEASLLKLNCDKALFDLSWQPTMEFQETVKITIDWYKYYYENQHKNSKNLMLDLTISQINFYTSIAVQRKIPWAIS